ncbi:MAG: hypothetical protein ACRC2K_03375 [Clostridium sp.]
MWGEISKTTRVAIGLVGIICMLSLIELSKARTGFMYIPLFPIIGFVFVCPISFMMAFRGFGRRVIRKGIEDGEIFVVVSNNFYCS